MAGEERPRRCLVLGGSGALGRAVCETLAAAGARLAFTFHRGEEAARTLGERLPGSAALRMDLRLPAEIESAVAAAAGALGGLDALVQCAAVAARMECAGPDSRHRIAHVDPAAWDELLDVNVRGTFFAVKHAAPLLQAAGGGNLVLVGSIDGVKPVPSPVAYAATRGALAAMTPALAKELGAANIRVNLVAAGLLEGGMSATMPEDLRREYLKHCGLRRLGRFGEIAAIVSWLALENTYVTGQVLVADGAL